jgi:HD-GYP domain-containing protein (c-di-GMP phosphodiesterase class II)
LTPQLSAQNEQSSSRLEGFGLIADRELVRRVAVVMLVFGGALEVLYSVFFHEPDWTDAAALVLTAIAMAWVLAIDWEKADPRLMIPPVLIGVVSVGLIVVGDGVAVGMSFLFLPACVVTVFFWNDLAMKLVVLIPLSIAFVAVPAIWGDEDSLIEAVTSLPLLLGSSIVLGATFNRFRMASVEQARFRGTITALLMALDARDDYTAEHASEVLSLVMAVAEDIGLDPRETLHTADVALLHDIGKIGIPNEILVKPAPLDEKEWAVMRRHPEIGERILREVPGFESVATAVRHEHERWDGGGYPDGLKGEEIPMASRIVLACDSYHAMISKRPYRAPLTDAQAREQLRVCSGSQFDPKVVGSLLAALEQRDVVAPATSNWRDSLGDGVLENLRVLDVDSRGGASSL